MQAGPKHWFRGRRWPEWSALAVLSGLILFGIGHFSPLAELILGALLIGVCCWNND
jgi:hypothetical protein